MRSASFLASFARGPDLSRRLRPDARDVINLSIVLLSALVVALALRMGWHSMREYRQARLVERVDATINDFIAAATSREMERTYGDALLAGARPNPRELRRLALARRQGDLIWQRAMDGAEALAADFPIRSELAARLSSARSAFAALSAARGLLDACLEGRTCRLGRDAWQQAATREIENSVSAREAVYLLLDAPDSPTRLYAALQRLTGVITEYTGRERGLVAFYLSEGRLPPPAVSAEVEGERAVADHARENLRALSPFSGIHPAVRDAMAEADRSLTRDFAPLLEAVLHDGLRPDGPTWLTDTAPTIAALAHLSAAVDEAVAAIADASMRDDRADLYLNGLVILLAAALAALSVTKVRQAANALFRQKELAEVTLRSIGNAVITTDAAGRVEYINPAAELMTGWRAADARGMALGSVFAVFNGVTLEPQGNPIDVCLRENRVVSLDNSTILVSRDGTRRYIEDSAAPIRDRAGALVGGVLVFYDATEAHQSTRLLEYRASHDALTGLFNRREFERRLAALLARGRDDSSRNALLVLDLDRFALVNETCGHAAGDHLLREIGRILEEHRRESDVLARLGADEFGLIIRDRTPDEAREIGESLRSAVAACRFEWQGARFQPHVSVGLVPFGLDAGTPAELLRHADAACHLAKEKGRDRLQVYDGANVELEQRFGAMHWIARLNHALAEDRFVLYCQPILSARGEGARRGEVLVRMLDADGTPLLPEQFIPPAERFGLMPRLDRWIVRATLASLAALGERGRAHDAGVLAINLSGATLSDPSMVRFIQDELRVSGVAPETLCFEITETAAVASLAETSALIDALRGIGCSFALDDFGRGMSSFIYLKQLPVDYLKIDGEFVRGMAEDPVCRAMVQAFHALGRAMGIPTVAECVESAAVRRQLETLGVDYMQGFEIARPQPLSQYLQARRI